MYITAVILVVTAAITSGYKHDTDCKITFRKMR